MQWLVLPLLVSAAAAAPDASELQEGDREGKLFSVFQIVRFNNDACTAVDGSTGTCYTESECTANGGENRGKCASGFGVCCVAVVDPCDTNVRLNNSYIVNRGFPGTVQDSGSTNCAGSSSRKRQSADLTSAYTINKAASDIVQIRIDFVYLELSAPMMGDCSNDTIVITGADAVSQKIIPSNLCGTLTGQHMYISVKDVDSVTMTITLSSLVAQKWQILVRQYDSTQTEYLAPRGCLQYFRQDNGVLETYNYNDGNGELLNNHMYTYCIAQNDLYCDVALTSSSFMLGGSSGSCSDAAVFGLDKVCGSTFGNSGSLTWNYTGNYNVPFMSDADNSAMDGGFKISYVLLPC